MSRPSVTAARDAEEEAPVEEQHLDEGALSIEKPREDLRRIEHQDRGGDCLGEPEDRAEEKRPQGAGLREGAPAAARSSVRPPARRTPGGGFRHAPARRPKEEREGRLHPEEGRPGEVKGENRAGEQNREECACVPPKHQKREVLRALFFGDELRDERLPDGIVAAEEQPHEGAQPEKCRKLRGADRGIHVRRGAEKEEGGDGSGAECEHGAREDPPAAEVIREPAEDHCAHGKDEKVDSGEGARLPGGHARNHHDEEGGRSGCVAVEKGRACSSGAEAAWGKNGGGHGSGSGGKRRQGALGFTAVELTRLSRI